MDDCASERGLAESPARCQFASDNYSGICPEALEALVAANAEPAPAYGNDRYTARACEMLRDLFEADCEVFFVASGTAGNGLALASLCQSYHAVVCHRLAHVETDECGAPEFFSNGTKLLVADGRAGIVDAQEVASLIHTRTDIHFPKPRVLTISQATEVGTVYAPEKIRVLGDLCRRSDLKLHMDGARFANAIASLGVSPAELTWKLGVDVLTFGGAKNGLGLGEAILFFDRELADGFGFRCKQAGHLLSKLRFITAQWTGLLESGAWLRNAQHANRMAQRLSEKLAAIPGVEQLYPREANSVFVRMTAALRLSLLQHGWKFYDFIGGGGARFMCSWSTTDDDVNSLARDLAAGLSQENPGNASEVGGERGASLGEDAALGNCAR
jgi:threonine aldolase